MVTDPKPLIIKQDLLQLTVKPKADGYLYLFQAGSDRKTINMLFPNELDQDNRVTTNQAVALPRASWSLRSSGPEGKTTLIALLSAEPKNFSGLGQKSGPFRSMRSTRYSIKNFVVEATGANPGGYGRYGASDPVEVVERNP